jgi:hypothetical protein
MAKFILGLSLSFGVVVALMVAHELFFKTIKAKTFTFQPSPVDDYTVKEICIETTLFFKPTNRSIPTSYAAEVVSDSECAKNPFHTMKEGMVTRYGCQRSGLVLRCQQPLGKFVREANEAAERRMKG